MYRTSRPPRLMKKRRKRIVGRSTIIFLLVIVLLALPAVVTRFSFIKITNVVVSGTEAVSASAAEEATRKALGGSYLYVYPKDNIFLFSKKDIISGVKEEFLRVSAVDVSIEDFHTLSIKISEREPNALWCKSNEECYFLDRNGLVFDTAPSFTGAVYISFWGDLVGDGESVLGSNFLDQPTFVGFSEFISALKIVELKPVAVRRIVGNEYEIELSTGERILISTAIPFTETISNLSSLLSDQKLSLRSESGLNVHSLDLRYGNKVFFVRKGEDL